MWIIHWMCSHTILDKIRNVVIRYKVGVTLIEDKMREVKLRLFSHISRSTDAPVKRCEKVVLSECRRGRGRSRKNETK